ncbi:hypothetical protein BJ322DRAFT_1050061 [Thelephora terrestris]|uniref:HCP-like protein n=1 Tax=Thelephora terrestris TaxID=56493 RepID=A0A9P6L9L2_9AGAM|nr:hypothetical protein BJ322DRAFT_1050061 [Thelephora terrestris]
MSNSHYNSPPHFEDPLIAPRPHKVIPDLPANMAQNLDDYTNRYAPPQQHQLAVQPGFVMPGTINRPQSTLPPPAGSDWSPWSPVPQPAHGTPPHPYPSSYSPLPPQNTRSPSPTNPALTAPLPTVQVLTGAIPSMQNPSFDPARKVVWCRDIFFLVDHLNQSAPDGSTGPVHIEDPQLLRLTQIAVPILLAVASPQPMPNPIPLHVAEAIYLRATLEQSGAFPEDIPLNPRVAFRDYEQAARSGYAQAWFKLGRDYEGFGDEKHARTCFERGVKAGSESCLYRIGMAHLLGQLALPVRPDLALPLLQRAATLATIQVAQPAYVYGLLLLGEFSQAVIPPHLFSAVLPPGVSPQLEARKHLERAAYLNFSPAQYKLGHAYEFAEPPFPFDALLSVQYYSLASQQGEIEADMALSKWFLCGAEGAFDKDESLAYTFADKAARKGLPSAEFAMGYYAEVGVGGPKDIDAARRWYQRAMQHGNQDAKERLTALSQPDPDSLSRQQHEVLTETTLVRKRTQAKQRSDASGQRTATRPDGKKILETVRKGSFMMPAVPENDFPPPMPSIPSVTSMHQQQQPPPQPQQPQRKPQQQLQQQPPHQPQPPQQQQQPVPQKQRSPTLPPQPISQPPPQSAYPPGQRPLPGGSKPFGSMPRYTLTDPGSRPSPTQGPSGPGPSPPKTETAEPGKKPMHQQSKVSGPPPSRHGSEQRPPSQPKPAPGPQPIVSTMPPPGTGFDPHRQKPGKGAQTFQEMGIATAKVEEKDCVIM